MILKKCIVFSTFYSKLYTSQSPTDSYIILIYLYIDYFFNIHLAKVLVRCIDSCLPDIISDHQTGFIRGRQMSSNIQRLLKYNF